MSNEKMNLNLKLIEEKINNKFLELKYNFETQNQEISNKIKDINNFINKIPNKKEITNNSSYEERLLKLENDFKKYESMINIKKDDENNNLKNIVKKMEEEFTLIKIRFSELLDFIKDKNFWKNFINNIIVENDLISSKIKKKNNKNKNAENNNNINNIFAPFNYYIYFGVEENKNFIEEGSNTIQYKNDSKYNVNEKQEKNKLIIDKYEKNEEIMRNTKYKTPNNIPNLNIMKNFNQTGSNLIQNLKQNNNNLYIGKDYYKKIPKYSVKINNRQHSFNNEEDNEYKINAIKPNKSISDYSREYNNNKDKIKKKDVTKVTECILQPDIMSAEDKNRNSMDNLSQAYIMKQSKKIKNISLSNKDKRYYRTLPLSLKHHLKNSRNNSVNRFNILSYKDFQKGNIEDLYYSQLKKDRMGHFSAISGINFRTPGYGEIKYNTIDKKIYPIIYKDKSK